MQADSWRSLKKEAISLPFCMANLFTACKTLFNRQALGEFLALSFFPLVLASLFLLRKGTTKCWPLLTLAMTGIGLAHFISIEMVSIWIGLYILFYWQQFFKKEVLWH